MKVLKTLQFVNQDVFQYNNLCNHDQSSTDNFRLLDRSDCFAASKTSVTRQIDNSMLEALHEFEKFSLKLCQISTCNIYMWMPFEVSNTAVRSGNEFVAYLKRKFSFS